MIECALIDLVLELGHTLVPFNLVTVVLPHSLNEVSMVSNHSTLPSGHDSFLHALAVSCYHSFWAVKLQICLCLVTLGSIICKCLQVFSLSAQDVKVFA